MLIGFMLSLSVFIDDLTTTSSDSKPAVISTNSLIALAILGVGSGAVVFAKQLLLDFGGEHLAVELRNTLVANVGLKPMEWCAPRSQHCLNMGVARAG